MIFALHTPSRLDLYTDDRVGTFNSLKFLPSPLCLWKGCTQERTALFCRVHAREARRATRSGTLPSRSEMIDLRPSQVTDLTAPLQAALPAVVPPLRLRLPRPVKLRACLWPDCGRKLSRYQSLCPRDKHRHRCLIERGDLPDRPLSPDSASALPALWQAHLKRPDERQWPRAARVVARPGASDGSCIALGCDAAKVYGRGLCESCYRQARYQRRLCYFAKKGQMNVLDPQPDPISSSGDVWLDLLPRLPARLRPHAEARRLQGIDRYGVPLQAGNGRDPRIDAFQEMLDGMAYAEQAVQEGYPWAAVRDRMIGLADEVAALIGLEDGR